MSEGDDLVTAVHTALRRDPHRVAVVAGRRRVLAGDLSDRIERLAARLAAAGIGDASTVAFAARGVAGLTGLLAIRHVGARVALVDPTAGPELVAGRIRAAGADLVLADAAVHLAAGRLGRLARRRGLDLPALGDLGAPVHLLDDDTSRPLHGRPGARGLLGLPSPLPRTTRRPPAPSGGRDALMIFTSGTTAQPKAVVHTEHSIRSGMAVVADLTGARPGWTALGSQFFVMLPALLNGCTVVLPQADARHLADQLRTLRPDLTYLNPPQLSDTLDAGAALTGAVFAGSAPVPAGLLTRARRAGARSAWGVYALTEVFPVAAVEADSKAAWVARGHEGDLVGPLLPGVRARVHAADSQLLVSGPNAADRYLDHPPMSEVATGDVAELTADGVVLAGRSKDMILRRAENIYPGLYEPALHVDGVNLVVLVGVPHPVIEGEQLVVACVQTAPGARPDEVRRALERRYAVMGAARPDHTLFLPIALGGRSRKPDRARIAVDAAARLAGRS